MCKLYKTKGQASKYNYAIFIPTVFEYINLDKIRHIPLNKNTKEYTRLFNLIHFLRNIKYKQIKDIFKSRESEGIYCQDIEEYKDNDSIETVLTNSEKNHTIDDIKKPRIVDFFYSYCNRYYLKCSENELKIDISKIIYNENEVYNVDYLVYLLKEIKTAHGNAHENATHVSYTTYESLKKNIFRKIQNSDNILSNFNIIEWKLNLTAL